MPESGPEKHESAGLVSAVVLAAGASERMGEGNKLLLPLGGRQLITHVVDAVGRARIGELLVVTGYQPDRLREALAGRDVAFVHNHAYERGMATSFQAGIRAASADCSGYMICLADLPLIATEEYDAVIDAFGRALSADSQAIVRPVFSGQPGHPVILASSYRAEIAAHGEARACRNIVHRNRARVRELEWTTDNVVRDVDTNSAYASLLAERTKGA